MIRISLLLLLAAMIAGAVDRPDLPANLTLSQALNIALANSTIIRASQARLEQESGRYEQARAPLLPQMGMGIIQNVQTTNLVGIGVPIPSLSGILGPFGSMDARLLMSQDLLNVAEVRAWQSSRLRRAASRLMAENAREFVAINVVAIYLDALRAKASRNTLSAQVKLAEDLYKLTRERVTQGVSAELDANRAMQQVNSLEQQRQESEQTYIATKLTLANLLQARPSADFEVADNAAYGVATSGPLDRELTIKTAFASRLDYRAAESSVKAAELQVQSAKAARVPTLRMTFADGQSGSTPVHNVNVYKLQGSIEFPIYTGGRIEGQIEEAEGALHEARVVLDENRSQIETDVLTAMSGVEWAIKEVQTSAGNVKLSRQEVELTTSRFSQGIVDNTEVVNAQERLARADDAGIRAEYTLGLARANLARAMGMAEKTYRR